MTTANPLVCLGSRLYEARAFDIPKEFAGDALAISDVAVVNDRVFALRRASPELLIFDLKGHFIDAVGLPNVVFGHGLRRLNGDHLALVDLDGHKVLILNNQLQIDMVLNKQGIPSHLEPFNHPTDCAQSPDGRIFVADGYGNSCVHVFDAQGEHLRTFGKPGCGPGEFSTPHAILVDPQSRLCVADRENNRIQRFSLEGKYIDEITGLYKPMALELTSDGLLLVTDQTPRLSAYDDSGALKGRCRTFGTFGHGLTAHASGSIYVAEMLPNSLKGLFPSEQPQAPDL